MKGKRQMIMTFRVVFVLMLTLIGSSARADLISFYDFEGPNPYDDKITGAVGTVGANVAVESGTPLGNAGVFPDGVGADKYILVAQGDAPVIGLSDFTIMAWVRRATVTIANGHGICDMIAETGEGGFQFLLFSDLRFGVGGPGGQWVLTKSVTQLTQDTNWHHYAVSVDRDNPAGLSVYIDGVLDSATDPTGYASVSIAANQDYEIGSFNANSLDGSLDDLAIFDTALTVEEIQKAMKGVGLIPELAADPNPEDATIDVPRHVVLNWSPGEFAAKHNLYLGTSFDDVNTASAEVLVGDGLDANSLDVGSPTFGQTYYWRVDEVNGAPDFAILKGNVWSFEVEPYSIPIAGSEIIATASSASNEESLPENTLNGSGLDANDMHTITTETMWFTAMGDATPWIQYEFDGVKKLDTMTVWNSNSSAEGFIGYGVKGVLIEYSVDGQTWDVFEDVNEFSRAPGLRTYNQYDEINLAGLAAKMVRLNIQSNWGGVMQSYSLSEVQFSMIPAAARTPLPDSGSVDILPDAVLSWRAGREAAQSTVYVSTDPNDVADGIAASAMSNTNRLNLSAFDIELGQTYYWRVDEVNTAEAVSTWTGPVWSFSTVAAMIVDDFESYRNDSPDRPFQAWLDGFGYSADEFFPAGYGGNGTGAAIGHDIWSVASPHYNGDIMETSLVYRGSQSMPFYYTNTGGAASETQRTFTPQDWTASGIKTLSLMFYGQAGNTGTLYIKINDTKVTYPYDSTNIARYEWQAWNIDLSSMDVQAVTKLQIGVDGASVSGMILIDDIKLYPTAVELLTPAAPGSDNLVGHWNFDEGAGEVATDVSGNGNNGDIVNGTWETGPLGSALKFDGTSTYVNIPAAAWSTIDQQATVSVWMHIDSSVAQTPFTFAAFQDPANMQTRVMLALVVYSNGNLYFDSGGDGTGFDRIFKAVGPNEYADTWIHWAFTKNAETGEQKIYRNGILWHSGTGLIRPMTGVTSFTLGAHNQDRFWNGTMDDFRLFNKELSQEEILWLAGRTSPVAKPF